jgi:hypothetical protein
MSPINGRNQFGLPGYDRNAGNGSTWSNNQAEIAYRNYASRLPEVYSGHPNRIERYNQYENMDMDSEINACLDIISEFSTQKNDDNGTPFSIDYTDTPTDNEVNIIRKQLQQWCKINQLDRRIFKLFERALKPGQ